MPVELQTTRDESTEIEMLDVFTLDGTTYQMPAKPGVNVALKYLRNVRKRGVDYAVSVLMEEMLGDGYEALCEHDELTVEQFQTVIMIISQVVMGALEGPGKASA